MIRAHFVGGPIDGDTRNLFEGTDTFYVMQPPPIPHPDDGEAVPSIAAVVQPKQVRYRKAGETITGTEMTYIYVIDPTY